jgi:DNA-binding IclR family transcriptional regulator
MMEYIGMSASPNTIDKALALLARVLEEHDKPTLATLSRAANLPLSTTHRLLGSLERAGLVLKIARNHYVGGPTLRRLAELQPPAIQILADMARPILAGLSRRAQRITHLGVLEDNMMTYLVKEGDPESRAPSKPDMQLEAYCTGVGKALLAHLPKADRDAYLSTAPFVSLTPSTIVSADALQEEFTLIRDRGYAIDNEEMFDGFICIAVPVSVGDQVVAAVSLVVSRTAGPCRPVNYLGRLRAAAIKIERKLVNAEDMFN